MAESSSSPPVGNPASMHQDQLWIAGMGGKERREPSITPRKFRRFFTPRCRVSPQPSAARRALRDLTARALNGPRLLSSSPVNGGLGSVALFDKLGTSIDKLPSPRSAKRRKMGHPTPQTSPLRPSSNTVLEAITPEPALKTIPPTMLLSPLASSPLPASAGGPESDTDDAHFSEDEDVEMSFLDPPCTRITPLAERGLGAQLLQRQLGTLSGPGHRYITRPITDWRADTADFYSTPDDNHYCNSYETENSHCVPFCAAPCNTNGMVAVGDEEGRVRLLDTDPDCADRFNRVYLSFRTHSNAVLDLEFSEDDRYLATAAADKTGRVFDMMTQTPISILDHHTASLKQVRFQPGKGGGNVLATSGRDGCVKIWDLRCKGGPAQDFSVSPPPTSLQFTYPRKVSACCVVNSINDAHARVTRTAHHTRSLMQPTMAVDAGPRREEPGRAGEVSVTAIQFLPPGQEHLILSACEADASIKLWDIRSVHTSRQKTSKPISVTAPPASHSQFRPFGMSSMSLSTDGARLYASCKDNTVYAYSTAHLVLGVAPELSSKAGEQPRRRNGIVQEGLGPLYGFRHEQFHATTFYVKMAIRPMRDGQPELLAVGSSDGCAVLFPTDERYFMGSGGSHDGTYIPGQEGVSTPVFSSFPANVRGPKTSAETMSGPAGPQRPGGLFRTNSMTSIQGGRLVDTIPIIRSGTALIRGHNMKEVGYVCWAHDGSLVTVGDNNHIRCWREDRDRATDLRTGGEGGGRRWGSGWADVGEDWDQAEDEWFDD